MTSARADFRQLLLHVAVVSCLVGCAYWGGYKHCEKRVNPDATAEIERLTDELDKQKKRTIHFIMNRNADAREMADRLIYDIWKLTPERQKEAIEAVELRQSLRELDKDYYKNTYGTGGDDDGTDSSSS